MKQKTIELVKDIFAYAVIIMRTGNEEILDNWELFTEMLNQATDMKGNRSFLPPSGRTEENIFTPDGLRRLILRLPPNEKKKLLIEFEDAIEGLNVSLGCQVSPLTQL